MVGADEEGMEGTDGGVLDLVAVHCCPMLVSPPHCMLLLPPHCVSTSSHIVVASSPRLLAMLLSSHVVVLVPWRFHLWAVVFFHRGQFCQWVVICVRRRSFSFATGRFHMFALVGGCLHWWAVVCICRRSVSLLIVVGRGRRVVVVVSSIVLWCLWWLMEERRDVTHCDISMMFKLTGEIT